MNDEQVEPKVKAIIGEVLGIDADEIHSNSRVVDDLNAQSIDFIDIVFQLEDEFDVKIALSDLEEKAKAELGNEAFEQNGVVTKAGRAQLKQLLPEVPAHDFPDNLKTAEIPNLFTVQTFCRFIRENIQ